MAMNPMYWRSSSVSASQLFVVALLSIAGLQWIEHVPADSVDELYEVKMRAAVLAQRCYSAINVERIRLKIPLETEFDPAGTGLIGSPYSPLVSNGGHLQSKQTSANPNFAAVLVEMLHEAGVTAGSVVAVNVTGSFPAMNVNAYAALEAMDTQPIVISSVAASEYGATHPELTWLDMERVLFEQDLISFRSSAATMGGVLDRAKNHSPEGLALIEKAIKRNKLRLLYPSDYEDAVQIRLRLFDALSEKAPIKAYINVGGGTASVGMKADKTDYRPGLNLKVPLGIENHSVMRSYLRRGIPVIHLSRIRSLARRYGLADAPVVQPAPGEGRVFRDADVQRWPLAILLASILVALYGATHLDIGAVFGPSKSPPSQPEQMV